MSGRLEALEARRRHLLNSVRSSGSSSLPRGADQARRATHRLDATLRARPGRNPLTWIAGLVGLLLMLRRRRVLASVGWMTGLLALASRATTVLRVIAQLRAVYRSLKSTRPS